MSNLLIKCKLGIHFTKRIFYLYNSAISSRGIVSLNKVAKKQLANTGPNPPGNNILSSFKYFYRNACIVNQKCQNKFFDSNYHFVWIFRTIFNHINVLTELNVNFLLKRIKASTKTEISQVPKSKSTLFKPFLTIRKEYA